MVGGVGHLALHLLDDVRGSGQVGVADAQADDVHPAAALLGDLALHLREQIGRQIVHASGELHARLLVDTVAGSVARWPSAIPAGAEARRESSPVKTSSAGPVMNTRDCAIGVGVHLDGEVATQQVHQHRARGQAQPHAGRPHGRRPGAAGLGLPHSPLPHPHAAPSRRPRIRMNSTFTRLGKSGMMLDQAAPRRDVERGRVVRPGSHSGDCPRRRR